jgi:hypothetical protein
MPELETGDPPYKPSAAGLMGFFFGPMAAALVSYKSLKLAGELRRGKWVLWLTVPAIAAWSLVVRYYPDLGDGIWRFALNLVSTGLYPWLQKQAFEAWQKRHPVIQPTGTFGAVPWGMLGLLLMFVVIGVTLMVVPMKVTGIRVQLSVPQKVRVGEDFLIEVAVENQAARPQVVRALGLPWKNWETFTIRRAEPEIRKQKPVYRGRRFILGHTIPAGGRTVIRVWARTTEPGPLRSQLAVCIQNEANCVFQPLETIAERK